VKRGKTLKKLQQSSADPLVDIWFEDEVHFTLRSTITRMWSPVGLQPKVHFEPNRLKVGYFGVVNINTGELFTQTAYPFNGETFEKFMRLFLADKKQEGRKIVMVLDNARWHKSITGKLKEEYPESLEFLYLPPYSPDLNPIERVWRITRRKCTHNKYFQLLETLADVLDSFFASLAVPNPNFV
jgi:transposase